MGDVVALPSVREAVDRSLQALVGAANLVTLTGPATAGKSTVLREVEQRLAAEKRPVLRIAVPRAEDEGPVALSLAAVRLEEVQSGLLSDVKDLGLSWREKLNRVIAALDSVPEAVLLLDEPCLDSGTGLTDVFRRRAAEVSAAFLATKARKLVALPGRPSAILGQRVDDAIEVSLRSEPAEFLDPRHWNGLGDAAARLLSAAGPPVLQTYSPLELRLLVGLVDSGADPGELAREHPSGRQLVPRILGPLARTARIALQKIIGRLALVRVPFDASLLEALGADKLDRKATELLLRVVLFGNDDALRLHELFASEASRGEWLGEHERATTHALLARHHLDRFKRESDAWRVEPALRHELEASHHLVASGNEAAVDAGHFFFVEQLDALGKALGIARKYAAAVRVYERALQHDPEDAYAHHYKAYNLDVQGRRVTEVEDHYRTARKLEPTHPWYHGRLICFLVTRGREADSRLAWAEALRRLRSPGGRDSAELYSELHRPLLRLLLHRGRLEFAEEVMQDIPAELRDPSAHAWLTALERLHSALSEAERDELVFPPTIPLERRSHGPHIRGAAEGAAIKEWMPGRLDSIDEDGTHHFRVARRQGKEWRFGWRDVTAAELRKLDPASTGIALPAGTFVEFVRTATAEWLSPHPQTFVDDPALPGLHPDPARYLRVAAASRS